MNDGIKITGYELYTVFPDGRVWSTYLGGRYLKPGRSSTGYLSVFLSKDGLQTSHNIHRLVADAFVDGWFDGAHVNHKNGIKTDNRAENLEFVSRAQNLKHAVDTGLLNRKGSRHPLSKLKERDVVEIRKMVSSGRSQRSVAKNYSVSPTLISKICTRANWQHV